MINLLNDEVQASIHKSYHYTNFVSMNIEDLKSFEEYLHVLNQHPCNVYITFCVLLLD